MLSLNAVKTIVLDTHVWIWLGEGNPRAAAFQEYSGMALIPAICQWEISMLEMKKRMLFKPDPATWIKANLHQSAALEPLSPEIAALSCQLENFHGDPADRMIVATAITLGCPLATADHKILTWAQEHHKLSVLAC